LKEVDDAQRIGVEEIRVIGCSASKKSPKNPKSNYAVIGNYLYDAAVFHKIHRLKAR
jgi:glucose-1-phosphate thymidylyltransferase